MKTMKVLIVDDDRNFRFAMREAIPWNEHGFEVIGEAVHGKQALELLTSQDIDIVLTDMEMPVMGGVELTGMIKKQYPEIIVIALSAYDDFEFVKESMRLGAEEYILKQEFDGDKVIAVLENCCRQQLEKHRKVLDESEARTAFLDFLRGGAATCSGEKLGRKNLENLKNLTLFLVQCEESSSITGKHLKEDQLIFFMKYNKYDWLFIYNLPVSANAEISAKLKQGFSNQVKIGFCDLTGTYDQLPEMFARAETALQYGLYFPEKQEFHYLDYLPYEKKRVKHYLYQQEKTLISIRPEQIQPILEDMHEQLLLYMPEAEYVNRSFVNIYKECQKGYLGSGNENEIISFYNDVKKRSSIVDKINLTIERITENQRFFPYEGSNKEILKAMEYIQNHYSEEITLEAISAYVGLSVNYFSHLFKQEVGENLVSFVNKMRIEYAKRLLDNESMKVYEIAELVGYRSSTYFSTIFKKVTGLSISEYKDR